MGKSNSIIKQIAKSLLYIFVVCSYPPIFIFAQNAAEAQIFSICLPIAVNLVFGIIVLCLSLVVTRSLIQSTFVSMVLTFILINYRLIETLIQKAIPYLKYWHILPLVFFVALHIFYIITKTISKESIYLTNKVIFCVVGALILFNLALATPAIINKVNLSTNSSTKNKINPSEVGTGKPNVYYLIFDEYSGFEVIKNYYGYDNREFYDYLTNKKFSVSTNSYNEASDTTVVITNYMSLDYVVDESVDVATRTRYRTNAKLFKLLEEHGYDVRGVGLSEFMGLPSIIGSNDIEATTITGENIYEILMKNTFLYPFIKSNTSKDAELVLDTIEYMKNKSNFNPNSSMMTMLYLCIPHQPFIFDKDGKMVNVENQNNWRDKKYYLEQYIYTTKLIVECVDSITTNDPNSIIILQSDHSARASSDIELHGNFISQKDMTNILNAVYFQGESIDEILGQSGLNTLRITLSKLLNTEMPVLEVPFNE